MRRRRNSLWVLRLFPIRLRLRRCHSPINSPILRVWSQLQVRQLLVGMSLWLAVSFTTPMRRKNTPTGTADEFFEFPVTLFPASDEIGLVMTSDMLPFVAFFAAHEFLAIILV